VPGWSQGSGRRAILGTTRRYSARALDALRRRIRVANAYYYLLERRYLKEEGRLAERMHDTTGAARAYRHFLVIRDRPDPGPIADEVRDVRSRLSALTRRE